MMHEMTWLLDKQRLIIRYEGNNRDLFAVILGGLINIFRRNPRHSAAKTTILGPSRYLGRPSSGEVQLEHTVGVGFLFGSLIIT